MAELVSRFDLDGLEFNYTRLLECFPAKQAAENADIMTDFIRHARAILNQKDRNLVLGVRIPQQLAGCLRWGLDIPTWIREGLVDYIAPGEFGFTDFNAKWEDFTSLARAHDCLVYPQTQPKIGIELEPTALMTHSQYRAALQNIYAAGADGFSVQNHFFHWGRFTVGTERLDSPDRFREKEEPEHPDAYPNPLNFLKELKDPTTLTSGPRHYTFLPLWGKGRGLAQIYEKEEIVLPRAALDQRGTFRFRICDQLPSEEEPSADCKLVIQIDGLRGGDQLVIEINNAEIPSSELHWDLESDPPSCSLPISAPRFHYGGNQLSVALVDSTTSEGTISIERLDCYVP